MFRTAALAASLLTAAVFAPLPAMAADTIDVGALYATHCAACHGGDRLGGIGPALIPEALARMKPDAAAAIIASGRPSTQMSGFAESLNEAERGALVAHIFTPIGALPPFGLAQIKASHQILVDPSTLPAKPTHGADPLNLFTVVEAGDHHVTILDGDRFEPLWRFPSRFALHGGAKYSPDGRFVYLASRDGYVAVADLHSLQLVAEVRVGFNTRNIAVSADGRYVMAGNMLPQTAVLLDARDLTPLAVLPVADAAGKGSRVSAIYTAPPRQSFILALKDVAELWEVPTGGGAAPAAADIRRVGLSEPLDDFFFDPGYAHVFGAARDGKGAQVVALEDGRKVASLALGGMPHLGSGIAFDYQGRPVLATPHLKEALISVIALDDWTVIKTIPTAGPGFFLRGHETTPFAFADAMMSKAKDTMQILDTRSLEIVRTLRPEPGRTLAHTEFTRDGRFALVSVWEDDGALLVYDMRTLDVVKRIAMRKPVGKYNVDNKIRYSAGTSH